MDSTRQNGLEYFRFHNLHGGITQAVFTRAGGVSPYPWDSLNLGGTVGDIPEHIVENRSRVFSAVNVPVDSLFDVWQVHSADVWVTDHPRPLNQPHLKADAIITATPGVTLLMRFADCVPIFLHDPNKNVIGLVHAGWQGTVKKIVQSAVKIFVQDFDSRPEDIRAGIGPSIGPDHYEVGPDVTARVGSAFGALGSQVLRRTNGRVFFDLWDANRLLLEQSGVRNIEISGHCTACDTNRWFSHRAEKGKTGRFAALIRLNPQSKETNDGI